MVALIPDEDSLFNIALTLSRETDSERFDNYFFDSGTIYVYMSQNPKPFDFVTNLIHEIGHSYLANSPIGFLLQSLFELEARASDFLWNQVILQDLTINLDSEDAQEQREKTLSDLEQGRPRKRLEKTLAKKEAETLLNKAKTILDKSLKEPKIIKLVASLLLIEERRRLLIESSRLCQEAIATFTQLNNSFQSIIYYQEMLKRWSNPPTNLLPAQILNEIEKRKNSLSGIWQKGFLVSNNIYNALRSTEAVFLAGHIANHFSYSTCNFLDMPINDLVKLTKTTLLSPDQRFLFLANNLDYLKKLVENNDKSDEKTILEKLSQNSSIELNNENDSFQKWHFDYILNSKCSESILSVLSINPTFRKENINDNWLEYLMPRPPQTLIPPIIIEDGKVLAPNSQIEQMTKKDFIRSVLLKNVLKILQKLK